AVSEERALHQVPSGSPCGDLPPATLVFLIEITYAATSRTRSSPSCVPQAGMPFSGQPLRMVTTICSGLPPWIQNLSVRLGPTIPPAFWPWQAAQVATKVALPDATIAWFCDITTSFSGVSGPSALSRSASASAMRAFSALYASTGYG